MKTLSTRKTVKYIRRGNFVFNRATSKALCETAQQIRWNTKVVRASWGKTEEHAFLCISLIVAVLEHVNHPVENYRDNFHAKPVLQ